MHDPQRAFVDRHNDNILCGDHERMRDVLERVRRRQARSRALEERARNSLRGGPGDAAYTAPLLPVCIARADGARLVDVDGNEYIDCHMGASAAILGHRPAPVVAAVANALAHGVGPNEMTLPQIELAELVCDLVPGAERVAFAHSGSDAVAAAVRLVRATTRRSLFAKFESCYHGWTDIGVFNMSLTGPARPDAGNDRRIEPRPHTGGVSATAGADLLILPYNSPRALELIAEHADALAGVLMDPMPPFMQQWPERAGAFVSEVRRVTAEVGLPLVYDEVVTGFRLAPGGAQQAFSAPAQIASYGKITSGLGLPLSMVAGEARFLDSATTNGLFVDTRDGKAQIATTCMAGYLATVASLAQLRFLAAHFDDVARHLDANYALAAADLAAFASSSGIPVALVGHPRTRSSVVFGDIGDQITDGRALLPSLTLDRIRALLCLTMYLRLEGIYMHALPTINLSYAHTQDDVERIVSAMKRSLLAMRDDGLLSFLDAGRG